MQPITWTTLVVWVGIALVATVLGSVAIARLINQPLRDLSFAASRIREGEFDSRLDENTMTSEIRQVNMGFNRMAREDRKSTRLNSSHVKISYAVFCMKKKTDIPQAVMVP